jgi:hypothetical protein
VQHADQPELVSCVRVVEKSPSSRPSLMQGDGVRDTASLLPPLVEAGIRVLIYSGEADARECAPVLLHRVLRLHALRDLRVPCPATRAHSQWSTLSGASASSRRSRRRTRPTMRARPCTISRRRTGRWRGGPRRLARARGTLRLWRLIMRGTW